MDSSIADELSASLLKRFDEVYAQLQRECGDRLWPAKDYLRTKIRASSFKNFNASDVYRRNERAKSSLSFISSRWGENAFRVFFNQVTSKIYVDVNASFIVDFSYAAEWDLSILCDIARAIYFIHPADPNARNTVVTIR